MSEELENIEPVADWRESLPEQLRDAPYFKDAATPEQARSNIDGAAFWQGNSILKPGADAGDEAKEKNLAKLRELYPNLVDPDADDIFSRLGKPEIHDKYTVPENLTLGADEVIGLKQIAFKANLTDKQFQAQLAEMDAAKRTGTDVARLDKEEQALAIRAEWGEATDSYKLEVERFLRADPLTPAGILAALDSGNLSSAEYKYFHKMARSGDEVGEASVLGKNPPGFMTPTEGMSKASEIRERMMGMRQNDPMYQHLQAELLKAEKAAHAA